MSTSETLLYAAAMAALFICAAGRAHAADPLTRPVDLGAVVLTGWLHVEDVDFDEATVLVEVNGEVRSAPVSSSGRFEIFLPVGTEVKLRFEHPGHLTKEVIIDTRNAHEGGRGKRQRRVRFAVVLDAERNMAGDHGTPNVGSIGFEKESGQLDPQNTRKLAVGRRNKQMVF